MRQRLLVLILALGCIVLGAAAFFVRTSQDRTPPVITLEEEEISYTEGEDEEVLLQGITAKDNKDGDLSGQVFIDRIVQTGESTAVVYYGVMDKNNNVGTAKRKIKFHAANGDGTDASQPEDTGAAGAEGTAGAEGAAGAAGAEGAAGTEGTQQPDADGQAAVQPNAAIPVITLNADQLTIPVRTQFDPLSVVQDITDDVDDRNSLFQRIRVDGTYDVNTPGTYELIYYVTDSNGNVSETKTLVLTVQ